MTDTRHDTEVIFATDAQYKRFADEHAKKVKAHATAEVIARQFGDFAPDPAPSESSGSYRRRLAGQLQKHSKEWGKVDLRTVPPDAFDKIEVAIYADAVQEARKPTNIPPGQLVERTRVDESGRRIREYYGDPEAVWGAFKMPVRIVTGWGPK